MALEKKGRRDLYELFARASKLEGEAREDMLAAVAAVNARLAAELRDLLASDEGDGALPLEPTEARPVLPAGEDGSGSPIDEDRIRAELERLGSRCSPGERYRIGDELGRGAMGSVKRAVDRSLRRELAMKTVRDHQDRKDPELLARFLREARLLGRLDHPSIVTIHDLGVDAEGRPYFTMPVVQGEDLGVVFAWARAGEDGWSLARAVGVLQRVCEAMAYAHSNGVVHRDLKPSNVMVGRFGEVQVMDWGVARVRGEEGVDEPAARGPRLEETGDYPVRTMDGAIVGTLFFMPPEQALGRLDEVDERSDVYAIGAMLYELLAGRRPYEQPGGENSPHEVLARLVAGPPAPIGDLAADAPAELLAICEKAMARDREERYPGMDALAEDLRAFLEVRVVRAHATGALAELRKWVGRNRGTAASLLAVLLVILGAFGVVTAVQVEARAEVEDARDEALTKAETASRINEILAGLFRAPAFEESGRDVRVVDVLENAVDELDARTFEEPEVEVFLRRTIGNTLEGISRYDLALVQHERVLELLDSGPVPDMAELCEAIYAVSSCRWRLADLEGATRILRRGMNLVAAAGSELQRLQFMQQLAVFTKDQGRYTEAEPLYLESLEGLEDLLGPEDPNTLTAMNNYGRYLEQTNALEEAEGFYRRSLEGRQKVLPQGHPDILNSLDNLSVVLTDLEEYEEGLELARTGYDARMEVLGERHIHTLTSANNLGRLLSNMGRYEEAEAVLVPALEVLKERLGPQHYEVLNCAENVAQLMERTNRLARAEELRVKILDGRYADRIQRPHEYRQSLDDLVALYSRLGRVRDQVAALAGLVEFERELGDARSLALASSRLGSLRLALGDDYEASYEALRESLDLWEQASLGEGPELMGILGELSLIEKYTGRLEDALVHRERGLALERRLRQPDDPALYTAIMNYGTLLSRLGRTQEAERHLSEVAEWRRRVLGLAHGETLLAVYQLANLYRDTGRLEEAEKLYQEVLQAAAVEFGLEDPRTAPFLEGYARYMEAMGDLDSAADVYRESIELWDERSGLESELSRLNRRRLGMVLVATGDPQGAERLFTEALSVAPATSPANHQERAELHFGLAKALIAQGLDARAEGELEAALEVCASMGGGAPAETLRAVRSELVTLLRRVGRPDEAEERRRSWE